MPSAKSNHKTSNAAAAATDATPIDSVTDALENIAVSAASEATVLKQLAAPNEEVPAYQMPEVASLEDPLCTARTAQKVTFQDVTTASFLIKGGVEYTPCPVSRRGEHRDQ